jgi:hypothetical protein
MEYFRETAQSSPENSIPTASAEHSGTAPPSPLATAHNAGHTMKSDTAAVVTIMKRAGRKKFNPH